MLGERTQKQQFLLRDFQLPHYDCTNEFFKHSKKINLFYIEICLFILLNCQSESQHIIISIRNFDDIINFFIYLSTSCMFETSSGPVFSQNPNFINHKEHLRSHSRTHTFITIVRRLSTRCGESGSSWLNWNSRPPPGYPHHTSARTPPSPRERAPTRHRRLLDRAAVRSSVRARALATGDSPPRGEPALALSFSLALHLCGCVYMYLTYLPTYLLCIYAESRQLLAPLAVAAAAAAGLDPFL